MEEKKPYYRSRNGQTKAEYRAVNERYRKKIKEQAELIKKLSFSDRKTTVVRLSRKAMLDYKEHVRFLKKAPNYYFCFSGYPIIRQWYLSVGLNFMEANLLILMSYTHYFLRNDYKYWGLNKITADLYLKRLIEKGLVISCEVPGNSIRKRVTYVLTDKGRKLSSSFEKFYDKKMKIIRAEPDFQTGAPVLYLKAHEKAGNQL